MTPGAERFEVVRIEAGRARAETIGVIREVPCSLYVNRFELVTWMCTPARLEELALGFLLNERVIAAAGEVATIRVREDERFYVDVELAGGDVALPRRRILTSGCAGGVTFEEVASREERVEPGPPVTADDIARAVGALLEAAALYREARGVHTSGLWGEGRLLATAEDVGRHNTLDKLRGICAREGIDAAGRTLVSTGRISSEMLSKAAKMRCPVVASRTSPTALSVRLAREWGIAVAGYVRRGGMTVYAGRERIGV